MFNALQSDVRCVPVVLCQSDSKKWVWQFVRPLLGWNKASRWQWPWGQPLLELTSPGLLWWRLFSRLKNSPKGKYRWSVLNAPAVSTGLNHLWWWHWYKQNEQHSIDSKNPVALCEIIEYRDPDSPLATNSVVYTERIMMTMIYFQRKIHKAVLQGKSHWRLRVS